MKFSIQQLSELVKKAKSDYMEKSASKWTRMLEQGKLGGYSLARILRASDTKLGDAVGSRFNRNTLTPGFSFTEPQKVLSSGERISALRQSFHHNRNGVMHRTGKLRSLRFKKNDDFDNLYSLRDRKYRAGIGFENATNPKGLLPGDKIPVDLPAIRESIQSIRKGLRPKNVTSTPELVKEIRGAYDSGLKRDLRTIRESVVDRNKDNFEISMLKELWNSKSKRKGKKLWGITVSDDLAVDGNETLKAIGGQGLFDPVSKGVAWGKSAPKTTTRHEVAHGKHATEPNIYRTKSVSDLFRTARAFPNVEHTVTDPRLASEAIAQSIASSGGSRSARRFVEATERYGRSNLYPLGKTVDINPHLDIARAKDPSGSMSSIITQLHKNYSVDFPKQNLPLFPPQQLK